MKSSHRILNWCLLCPCLLLAFLVALLCVGTGSKRRPCVEFDNTGIVEVTGSVDSPLRETGRSLWFELRPSLIAQRGSSVTYPARIVVVIPLGDAGLLEDVGYGTRVRFRTFLRDAGYFATPSAPDFREIWWRRDVLHIAQLKSAAQLEVLDGNDGWFFLRYLYGYRHSFVRFCESSLSKQGFKLVLGSFLGERAPLEEADEALVRNLGILHLFVVSGFHVSIVLIVIHLLTRRFGRSGLVISTLGMWTYVVVVGAGPAPIRAGLMSTLLFCLLGVGLRASFGNSIGFAGLVSLLWERSYIFHAGFQFSYLALLSLATLDHSRWWVRALQEGLRSVWSGDIRVDPAKEERMARTVRFRIECCLEGCPRHRLRKPLACAGRIAAAVLVLFLAGLAVQIVTLPLALLYGNRWIPTQPLLQIPLTVAFSAVCLSSFVLFVTYWSPLGPIFAGVCDLLTTLCWRLMESSAEWSSVLFFPHPGVFACSLATAACLLLLAWPVAGRWILASVPALVLLTTVSQHRFSGWLEMTMLDVGQGEAIHIRYPNGAEAMMDTGGLRSLSGREVGNLIGERVVARYLWSEGITQLHTVFFSHPHADHIQGFDFLRFSHRIRGIVFNGEHRDYPPWATQVWKGDQFRLGGVQHLVMHPSRSEDRSVNDQSLVLRLEYGGFSILLTGDIEAPAEEEIRDTLTSVFVLKVAHHGGKTSSTTAFLQSVHPQIAIVSAGRSNLFGHPHPSVIRRLENLDVRVFEVARMGSLRLRTDGLRLEVLGWHIEREEFVLEAAYDLPLAHF